MKKQYQYIILLAMFIVLIFSITFSYVYIHYKEQGSIEVLKKYSEIMYSNIMIDYESDMSIKIVDKSLHVEIPNFKDSKKIEFSFDITNIGNMNVKSENYSITNISTNINENNIKISSSLKGNEIIKGGESKKIIVTIEYNGKEKVDDLYYNFNLNYSFSEVNL